MRLLVLEDDSALRDTLVGQFRDAGFAVDQAADGVEGEFAGLEYPIDVAVVDLGLDILASRVANMQSREAAANRFSGHWNMRGEKPYHRYAFAGGVDHVKG